MKRFFIVLSFVPGLGFSAVDGLHVVYDLQTQDSKNFKTKVEYYVAEGMVRFENQTAENPLGNLVLIRKTKPGKSFMLFPKNKTYMEVPETEIQNAQRDGTISEPFKSTGKKKEIVGYSCEVMARELSDRREEACTSSKLKKEYKNLQAAFPKTKSGETSIPKGMDGFPLEYRVIPKKKSDSFLETSMLVSELQKTTLSASLFEVPADYQQKSFPMLDPATMKGIQKPGTTGEQQVPENLQEKLQEIQKMMDEMKKKGTPQKK